MEDESKKEKSTLLKLNLRCRRAALLKIIFFFFFLFFAIERRRALDCFEKEVDSKMEGGESFDKM